MSYFKWTEDLYLREQKNEVFDNFVKPLLQQLQSKHSSELKVKIVIGRPGLNASSNGVSTLIHKFMDKMNRNSSARRICDDWHQIFSGNPTTRHVNFYTQEALGNFSKHSQCTILTGNDFF